ncbi:MAG: hypothetical protein EG823_05660 [Actinobacteria bacterium]|nr:hypothetical protein [Actinomycetota bacterium]
MTAMGVWRRAGIAAIVALIAALAYQAIGVAVFLPRFADDDPRAVVGAYYEAQRWGYRAIAEQALSPELRELYHAPNAVRGLTDDAFLSHDLQVTQPAEIVLGREYAEERQLVAEYHSVWNSGPLGPPGGRYLFLYVGRDAGEPWRITSIGTGP